MANLKSWVLKAACGEPIDAIVIEDKHSLGDEWASKEDREVYQRGLGFYNKVLSWEQAAPLIDYDFSAGYGGVGCQAICAWTKSWVIFVSQYDGSTSIYAIPRNPTDHEPSMPGG